MPDDLVSLVGADSMAFFRVLHLDTEFLNQPMASWPTSPSYMKAESVVKSMHVVNDAAERGVKLGSDFLDCAKIEEHYQDILQVAENDRHRVPNQRNRKAISKSWYLTM